MKSLPKHLIAAFVIAATLFPGQFITLLLAQPAPADTRAKALNALFADYWEYSLKRSPELASILGDHRYDDQLTDNSVAAYNAALAKGRAYIEKLSAIDPAGLPEQDRLSRDLLLHDLVEQQEQARFKDWQIPVNQFNGLHTSLAQLVPQLVFSTVEDYDKYIARLGKIPLAFQQTTENMTAGAADHRTMPKYLMEKVVAQVNAIATAKPEDSPFALPLKKFPAAIPAAEQDRIRTQVLDAIGKQVFPAYLRFAKYLTASYIPQCREEYGIWSVPDGDAYYAFLVRQSTTTSKTPAEIHQIGLDEVKRDETEMLAIAQKMGFKSIADIRAAMKGNPKLHPTSAGQLLDAYRGHIDEMRPKLPELFGRLPKANLTVEAVPAFMEKEQAAAYYQPGSPDGKRPGTFFVNTYKFADRTLTDAETTAYHEGIPGHHLQISIAQETSGLPEFRKYEYYTAYTEGWALYSERLGKEVGLYRDPYNDFGRLEADIWRAVRLVVDTGVHSKRWTRQQMVDFFHAHSGADEASVQAEVDRYIAWPAQALGYKMGQLKILELRQKAQTALGPKFDIKVFHDQVVDAGALPLDVLEGRIDTWIAREKAAQ